jgi:hypothetical protein
MTILDAQWHVDVREPGISAVSDDRRCRTAGAGTRRDPAATQK